MKKGQCYLYRKNERISKLISNKSNSSKDKNNMTLMQNINYNKKN